MYARENQFPWMFTPVCIGFVPGGMILNTVKQVTLDNARHISKKRIT